MLHRTLGTASVPGNRSPCGSPPLREKEHPRSLNACGGKGQKSESPQKIKVLFINHTLVMETGVLIPDLLYKPMAVRFG